MLHDDAVKFIEENMKTIFAYALSRVSHKEDAEDLAGDIILAILQSAPKIKDPDAFYGYVWAIAATTYRKFMRKRARGSGAAVIDIDGENGCNITDDADIAETVIEAEQTRALYRELSLLSREYRVCTVAHYFDGLTCAEIAEKYHISTEMVKYYLYKTRKILKEGISMEREFGQKSFRPAEFHFSYTYNGRENEQYRTLFDRRLPGNIMLSAYYTPMTLRELSVELGVATPYLEDEIAILESYSMIEKLPSGKYQTRLVIYTESYMEELHRHAESVYADAVCGIINLIRDKLPEIRSLGFRGSSLPDNRLLWALFWNMIHTAGWEYQQAHFPEQEVLYDGATGICYGCDYGFDNDSPYECISMSGRATLDDGSCSSFIDIGMMPRKNRVYRGNGKFALSETHELVKKDSDTPFVTISEDMLTHVQEIIADARAAADRLHSTFIADAIELMHRHAPEGVRNDIERVVTQSIFSDIMATLLNVAVNAGALALPDEDDKYPVAFFAIEK